MLAHILKGVRWHMITVINQKAIIEQVEQILSVNANRMSFRLKYKILELHGVKLRVLMYSIDEVWIGGEITQVQFYER